MGTQVELPEEMVMGSSLPLAPSPDSEYLVLGSEFLFLFLYYPE